MFSSLSWRILIVKQYVQYTYSQNTLKFKILCFSIVWNYCHSIRSYSVQSFSIRSCKVLGFEVANLLNEEDDPKGQSIALEWVLIPQVTDHHQRDPNAWADAIQGRNVVLIMAILCFKAVVLNPPFLLHGQKRQKKFHGPLNYQSV